MARPLVSVVVPVRDARPAIPALLDALNAQTVGRDRFEVVVVDDGSRDGTAGVAAGHALGPTVIERDTSRGSYAARNAGLDVVAAPVVAFTDADCLPDASWLEAALAHLGKGDALLVAGAIEKPLRDRPSLAEELDFARFLNQQATVRWGWAATANLFVPVAAFDVVGRFDGRLRSGGDVEWCTRAMAAGYRMRFAADARVTHPPRTRPRALARKAYRVGTGIGQMRRHGVGPWGRRRSMWRSLGAWRPPRHLQGETVLVAAGRAPGPGRRRALLAGQYVLVHLPILLGALRGELRR